MVVVLLKAQKQSNQTESYIVVPLTGTFTLGVGVTKDFDEAFVKYEVVKICVIKATGLCPKSLPYRGGHKPDPYKFQIALSRP